MEASWKNTWPLLLLALILAGMLWLTLKPYSGNFTALFHMGDPLASAHALPPHLVVLSVPPYDGAQYYQVARNIPRLIKGEWEFLKTHPPGPYAYQRMFLPLLAWLLSFGTETALPLSFLTINLISILCTSYFVLRYGKRALFALALALSPAATIGLHFSLAEPLTLLLITLFLLRFQKHSTLDPLNLLLLSLCVLTREVNIMFVAFTAGFFVWKQQWKNALFCLIPSMVFLLWHTALYSIFSQVPFVWSAEKYTFPLLAIWELLSGEKGFNRFTLSSIALFLMFVLPALTWTVGNGLRTKRWTFLRCGTLFFLLVMLTMPDHIWSSITSIGRAITPVYPFFLLHAEEENLWSTRMIASGVLLLGLAAGIGLALTPHPFTLS